MFLLIFIVSDVASINSGFTPVSSSFPLSAISLMVSSSPFYDEAVNAMVVATNMVYQDFLKSEEGQGFRGEVSTKFLLYKMVYKVEPLYNGHPGEELTCHCRAVAFVTSLIHFVPCGT